jgi:uncharacterized membrane protein YhaH (DUF805 family)
VNDFILAYKKYAQFNGRSGRKEFWFYVLFYLVVSAILSVIDGLVFGSAGGAMSSGGLTAQSYSPLASIFGLVSLVPGIAVSVRRLHDTGKSGWFYLLWLLPIIGWIILLVFYCQKSEPETNAYGAPPSTAPIA